MTKLHTEKFTVKIPVTAITENKKCNTKSIKKNCCSNCGSPLPRSIRKNVICNTCGSCNTLE